MGKKRKWKVELMGNHRQAVSSVEWFCVKKKVAVQ